MPHGGAGNQKPQSAASPPRNGATWSKRLSPATSVLTKGKVAQLCLTLCDPTDYTVPGILQARILEWVAFPFSRGSSQPRDGTQRSNPGLLHCRWILYHLSHQGSPTWVSVKWFCAVIEYHWIIFFSILSYPQHSEVGRGCEVVAESGR